MRYRSPTKVGERCHISYGTEPEMGENVSLESDFDMAWSAFLTSSQWLGQEGNNAAIKQLAAVTAGSIKGLAAQIDRLNGLQGSKVLDIGK